MMFFKATFTLSALLVLTSALTLERMPSQGEMSILGDSAKVVSSFAAATSACDKEDEESCKEYCSLAQQTSKCTAAGNKITCSCKGGKSESNCEERCLLCMPDKSALEEASRLFKLGGSKMEL